MDWKNICKRPGRFCTTRPAMIATLWILAAFHVTAPLLGQKNKKATNMEDLSGMEVATFGSGCFWCTEAIFLNVAGVNKVVSGYMGGKVKNPTYKADVGTQYRSVVFYHSEDQGKKAEWYKSRLEEEGAFDKPIVTEISPATTFYEAEDYHQNYYNLNSNAPYCTFVIKPKLEKFKKAFQNKLKK
jgi:peptide-methionine (S)-S-oxide reductase